MDKLQKIRNRYERLNGLNDVGGNQGWRLLSQFRRIFKSFFCCASDTPSAGETTVVEDDIEAILAGIDKPDDIPPCFGRHHGPVELFADTLPCVYSPRLKIDSPMLRFIRTSDKIVKASLRIENITKSYLAVMFQILREYDSRYVSTQDEWVLPPGGSAVFKVYHIEYGDRKLKVGGQLRILTWEVEKAMPFEAALREKHKAAIESKISLTLNK